MLHCSNTVIYTQYCLHSNVIVKKIIPLCYMRLQTLNIIGRSKEGHQGCPSPIFMQCSGNIWPNNRLAPRLGVGAPAWEILDLPLNTMAIYTELIVKESGQHSIPKPWNFSGYILTIVGVIHLMDFG